MSGITETFDRYDALGLAELVRRGEVKPIELVEAVIDRIERINPTLNCVTIKLYERAREQADGPLPDGPFAGVPLLVKDLILLHEGIKTTNACNLFKDFVAEDASVVAERIKRSGFILVAKTNTPEFGFNITTEPRLYGPTRNPWNTQHVAGGSSGGSGASVAARIVPLADGGDGGGSIRIPASNNGLVGLKPSRGRVPLAPHYGDIWYGQVITNCLSLTVRDTAAYLDVVAGPVPGDPYQPANPERPFLAEVHSDPGRLKIGFTTKSRAGTPVAAACVEAVEKAVLLCAGLGHELIETELTFDFPPLMETFQRIAAVLGAKDLEIARELIGREPTHEDLERSTWELYQSGRKIDGAQHAMDIDAMRQFSRQIAGDCESFDVVITPTMPQPPVKLGTFNQNDMDPDTYLGLLGPYIAFTLPFNVSGQPAISLPLHWSEEDLPIGVQFAARYAEEAILLRLAGQIEKARPWKDRKPPICA
jgi:amidase